MKFHKKKCYYCRKEIKKSDGYIRAAFSKKFFHQHCKKQFFSETGFRKKLYDIETILIHTKDEIIYHIKIFLINIYLNIKWKFLKLINWRNLFDKDKKKWNTTK